MKATINGIEVEGTPSELVDYMKRMDDLRREGEHIKPPLGKMPNWLEKEKQLKDLLGYKPYTKSAIKNQCAAAMNGGCYCTGACNM